MLLDNNDMMYVKIKTHLEKLKEIQNIVDIMEFLSFILFLLEHNSEKW